MARRRRHIEVRVHGVPIAFPVVPGSLSTFGRILEAPRKEPATQSWIAQVAQETPGGTLWDVGANIGLFTLLGGSLGLRVVAVEPLPSSLHILLLSVALNNLEQDVVIIPLGVSDTTGPVSLHVRNPNAGITGSSIDVEIRDPATSVSTISMTGDSLQPLLPEPFQDPVAVKLDVDGIELRILDGLRGPLSGDRLRHVMVEEKASDSEVGRFLGRYGFHLTHEENTNPTRPGRNVNRYFERDA